MKSESELPIVRNKASYLQGTLTVHWAAFCVPYMYYLISEQPYQGGNFC